MIWQRKKGEVISLEVEGIRCTQCEATIKNAVGSLPGVRAVSIRPKDRWKLKFQWGKPSDSMTWSPRLRNMVIACWRQPMDKVHDQVLAEDMPHSTGGGAAPARDA